MRFIRKSYRTDDMSNPDVAPTVEDRVRAQLALHRKTQSELATQLGLSQVAVSRRLSGKTRFTVDELRIVADYFGQPIAAFFGEAAA